MNAARLIVLLMCASTICAAQQPGAATPTGKQGHVVVAANAMKWEPAPPALPPGAQIAVLDGDPSQPGFFVMQIKLPDGYKVPPHWHPTDEHLVGLQGSLMVGTGEKFDKSGMHALTVGSYTKMPKEVRHFVWAKGETIVQVSAMGPFALTYVNPADDPRQNTPSAK
jgi:hypothetical protein